MYITDGEVACKVLEPELWFSNRDDSKRTRMAKALCRACLERRQCLDSTIRFESRTRSVQYAVFGGLTRSQRLQLYGWDEDVPAADPIDEDTA